MRIRIVADGVDAETLKAALATFARERRRIEQPTGTDEFCGVGNDGLYFKLVTPALRPESASAVVDSLRIAERPKVVKIN